MKFQIGDRSILINASKSTNFVYKLSGVESSSTVIEDVNGISTKSKIKDRISKIFELGAGIDFVGTEKNVFFNNLVLIDSLLPAMLSEILLQYYSNGKKELKELAAVLEEINPLNFDQSDAHQFYSYKLKRFVTDIALGMMPATVWTGQYDATGGYLVVKEDGDVLCYHVYNKNMFENYLLNHTRLETGSSSKHGFGEVYEEDGDLLIKLNLQIRFIK